VTATAVAAADVTRFSGSAAEWDAFVRRQPHWTAFHLHAWRDVVAKVFGHRTPYLAARDPSGELAGVLPLVLVASPVFGRFLVSMPFVNYGGPLGSPDAVRALADEAVRLADREKVKLLELRSRTELPLDLPVSHRKITVVLDLPDTTEKLMKSFEAKLRSQVRRPAKEGIVVRFGRDQLPPFYGVFAQHMRDLGTPVQPRKLFTALAAAWDESTRETVHRREAAAAWRRSTTVQGWSIPESDATAAVRGELRLAVVLPPDQHSSSVAARLGRGAMPGYPITLAHLPALADRLQHPGPMPGADALARRLMTLPCHRHVIR